MNQAAGPRQWAGASPWLLASGVLALLVVLPILSLGVAATGGSRESWRHLIAYVLPGAAVDSVVLLGGVGALAAIVGGGMAWLVTFYDFRGRRLLEWALVLPLAVPTYIIAYAYLDLLHPVGPVQTMLRSVLGFESPREFRLPDIRSLPACIVLLAFVLYPYVYLPTRALFLTQSANLIDAARTLGVARRAILLRIGLPLARPAIAAGLTLVLMESLNDIGASEFLGVRTLTVSIYAAWVARSDLATAAQLALVMLALVLALVLLERWARRRRAYADDAQHQQPVLPHRLHGWPATAAVAAGIVPIAIGFLVPAAYLVYAAAARVRFAGLAPAIATGALNTLLISIAATALMLGAAVTLVYTVRLNRDRVSAAFLRVASLGYAVPGTVLAIGLLPLITGLDAILDQTADLLLGAASGLFLLGSGSALIYAYFARFLGVAAGNVEAGFGRVPPSLDDVARTLGHRPAARLWRIHIPLTRPALASAALLVLIDCIKELPATLLLRPIGFETLATHLYGEAVRGTYEDGAIAALLIVAVGLVPVMLLTRTARSVG